MTKEELIEKLRSARSEYVSESDHYDAFDWAIRMAEELDEAVPTQDDHRLDALRYALGPKPQQVPQMGKHRNITVLPMLVQQEPSVLEMVLRLRVDGWSLTKAVSEAYELVDAVRAEEARRNGK